MTSLAETIASTPAMRAIFSSRATLQAMLDVEAALAKAGAACGFLNPSEAATIAAACTAEPIDIGPLAEDGALAGTVVVPLVKWLRAAVPGPVQNAVHIGGTSQDVLDNSLLLQLRAGIVVLQADLTAMAAAAAGLAEAHATTKMLGRTLLQAAMPITFGLKAANWLSAIDESRAAIAHAEREALFLQCGGAAGTQDALGDKSEVFAAAYGAALNLPVPPTPWHTNRAPLCRLAAAITGAVGVAGKIGTDIALMMQSEIAEVLEPAAPGRGASSAMAHKRNPTLSIAARAAALRAPFLLATLFAAQDQEHERAAGALPAEAATWPALMLCASGALAAMAEALAGLIILPDNMLRNLGFLETSDIPHAVPGLIARALDAHKNFATRLRT